MTVVLAWLDEWHGSGWDAYEAEAVARRARLRRMHSTYRRRRR